MHHIRDWLFRDHTGSYVVGQAPNVPIYLIVIGVIGERVAPAGYAADFFGLLATGAIFLWSYLEIRYGESKFRRLLGGFVMAGLILSRVLY